MNDAASAARPQRIMGGFRSILMTELGPEQICGACQQAWPLDDEFFAVTRNSISYQCKACISERARARPLYQPGRK